MYLKILTICSILALCACGGSSSSSGYQFPLDGAFTYYEQTNESFTLTATSGSDTYTLQITSIPGSGLSTFDGVSAYTSDQTETLSKNGTVISDDSQTLYYTIGPYTRVGIIDANGQETVYANQTALPDYSLINMTGAFDTDTTYTDSTRSVVYATGTTTWDTEEYPLQPNQPIAFACLDTVFTINGSKSPESDCYLMNTVGYIVTLQITMTVDGVTRIFK